MKSRKNFSKEEAEVIVDFLLLTSLHCRLYSWPLQHDTRTKKLSLSLCFSFQNLDQDFFTFVVQQRESFIVS